MLTTLLFKALRYYIKTMHCTQFPSNTIINLNSVCLLDTHSQCRNLKCSTNQSVHRSGFTNAGRERDCAVYCILNLCNQA